MTATISLFKPNRLAFPSRKPGFDPSHPASGKLGGVVCAVASQGNFFNLTRGTVSTTTGTPTNALFGTVGPGLSFAANTVCQFTIPANPASGYIWGGIFVPTSLGTPTNQCIVGLASTTYIRCNNTSFNFLIGGSAVNLFTGLVNGHAYFAVASLFSGSVNAVLLDLTTGILKTVTPTNANGLSTGNTTVSIGNTGTAASNNFVGNLAAAIYSPIFLSLPQLVAWAADLWAFWYPRGVESLIFSSLATPAAVATVTKRFLPIMGVGR